MNEVPDDEKRARRLAAIRANRGSEERLQAIADLEEKKQQAAKKRSKPSVSAKKTPENSTEMFGHPWAEWFQMRDVAFDYICQCASERRMATYGEVWNAISASIDTGAGAQWRQLPNLLGHVVEHTFPDIDLVTTAIVVADDKDEMPGPGFFRAAAVVGVLPDKDNPPVGVDWKMSDAQRTFWEQQRDALFAKYAPQ